MASSERIKVTKLAIWSYIMNVFFVYVNFNQIDFLISFLFGCSSSSTSLQRSRSCRGPAGSSDDAIIFPS
jgi:hypothetical protein